MAVRYRTKSFVFKKKDQGESNQIFTLYTENFGKMRVLGKAIRNIKSKLRSGIEVYYLSEIEFIRGKSYNILTDAVVLKNFKKMRDNLDLLKIAHRIVEISDKLIGEEEKDENIWSLLCEVFENLDTKNSPKLLYYYFLWNLLSVLGYKIDFYKCAYCQKKLTPEEIYFNSDGLICEDCFKKLNKGMKISSEIVKILRIFLSEKSKILKKLKIDKSLGKSLVFVSNYYLQKIG